MRPGKSTGIPGSGGWSPLWPVAAIFAVSMAVYLNALHNGFVWDDADQILTNAWIRDPGRITEIFTKNVWSFNKPVTKRFAAAWIPLPACEGLFQARTGMW